MVSNLQFAAVAAYLLWCLFSALTGVVGSDEQAAAQILTKAIKMQQSPSVLRQEFAVDMWRGVRGSRRRSWSRRRVLGSRSTL